MAETALNNIFYLHMDAPDVLLRVSALGSNLSGFMCGLFSIHGTLTVDRTLNISTKRCFLCTDLLDKDSVLPAYVHLPVLREIVLPPSSQPGEVLHVVHDFSQILWLDTAHTVVRDIRLFLMDETGQAFPVTSCFLKCTLLAFKKKYSK